MGREEAGWERGGNQPAPSWPSCHSLCAVTCDHKRMKASGAFQAEGVVNAHALSFPGLGNLEKGKEVM